MHAGARVHARTHTQEHMFNENKDPFCQDFPRDGERHVDARGDEYHPPGCEGLHRLCVSTLLGSRLLGANTTVSPCHASPALFVTDL